jgi:hypothetical protein
MTICIHSNFILAEIRLKRLNARSLISATDFGQTNAKIGSNQRTKNQLVVEIKALFVIFFEKGV